MKARMEELLQPRMDPVSQLSESGSETDSSLNAEPHADPDWDDGKVEQRIQVLTEELERLRSWRQPGAEAGAKGKKNKNAGRPPSSWVTIYRLDGNPYLEPPQWQHTGNGINLVATHPISDVTKYLNRNPRVLFAVFKDFKSVEFKEDDGHNASALPRPDVESMRITSPQMLRAMTAFSRFYSDFERVFPSFDFMKEATAPYVHLFHMFPGWEENVRKLDAKNQSHIRALFRSLESSYLPLYKNALASFERGKISVGLMPLFIRPGDVVVDRQPTPVSYMVTSWPFHSRTDKIPEKVTRGASRSISKPGLVRFLQGPGDSDGEMPTLSSAAKSSSGHIRAPDAAAHSGGYVQVWTFKAWRWVLRDGNLGKEENLLVLGFAYDSDDEEADIVSLNWHPLQYASQATQDRLKKRGNTFWRCRERHFVGYEYQADDENRLDTTSERFMVDFNTYRLLHSDQRGTFWKGKTPLVDASTTEGNRLMRMGSPPDDDQIYIFPSTIIGYNMRQKKWMDIEVDQIREVQWNKRAFESLAIDGKTKQLVRALVTNQIMADKSTDLIGGKGNGLLILLHGGPGTGKTLTADDGSVAELAEKPLYRVTCGDVGTRPEDVEKYLESVLRLGKIWGCVVLLDEADVFLEERSLTDLNRNALVSVFLRVLEYYDGILILTSNRVGTFDEAFKSRIQLALHYKNLDFSQRRQIWRNFFTRLRELGETKVDFDDLNDHVAKLAEEDMNGRQIRNAITTARQLAQFEGETLGYEKLKSVIDVMGNFETYLKSLKGLTSDQLAREEMVR